MTQRFRDRRVLVTGAAQGIGRAIAGAFLDEGARVCLADLNGEGAAATAAELGSDSKAHAVQLDVTDASAVRAGVERVVSDLGGIDVLVNNAGAVTTNSVLDLTEAEWDLVMDVNVKGVFLCTQAVLGHMLAAEPGGMVVNVASQAGKRGYKLFSHYCASKAAVINFTRAVALEVAPHVRLNSVCPGIVNTDMMEREYAAETALTGESRESIRKRWMASIPMGRFQEPEDVAGLVLFLASEDSSEMTGQAVNITGGMVMD